MTYKEVLYKQADLQPVEKLPEFDKLRVYLSPDFLNALLAQLSGSDKWPRPFGVKLINGVPRNSKEQTAAQRSNNMKYSQLLKQAYTDPVTGEYTPDFMPTSPAYNPDKQTENFLKNYKAQPGLKLAVGLDSTVYQLVLPIASGLSAADKAINETLSPQTLGQISGRLLASNAGDATSDTAKYYLWNTRRHTLDPRFYLLGNLQRGIYNYLLKPVAELPGSIALTVTGNWRYGYKLPTAPVLADTEAGAVAGGVQQALASSVAGKLVGEGVKRGSMLVLKLRKRFIAKNHLDFNTLRARLLFHPLTSTTPAPLDVILAVASRKGNDSFIPLQFLHEMKGSSIRMQPRLFNKYIVNIDPRERNLFIAGHLGGHVGAYVPNSLGTGSAKQDAARALALRFDHAPWWGVRSLYMRRRPYKEIYDALVQGLLNASKASMDYARTLPLSQEYLQLGQKLLDNAADSYKAVVFPYHPAVRWMYGANPLDYRRKATTLGLLGYLNQKAKQ